MSIVEQVKGDFPAAERVGYLNTGTVGIVPGPVQEKLFSSFCWFHDQGPALPDNRDRIREDLASARTILADFLGVEEDEVEFTTDTTAGMNAVIGSLPLNEGDEVVVSDIEHYVGRVPWQYLADTHGIKIVVAESRGGTICGEDIEKAITSRTRVISLSHVSFSTGGRFDIAGIGQLAEQQDIFLLVDAAQSVGALDLQLHDLNCDALSFPGYKWCLGPKGSGGLYINPRAWDKLRPPTVAMGGVESADLNGNYRLTEGPRMFAPSSRGYLDTMGLAFSLQYLNDLGMKKVQSRIKHLTTKFVAEVSKLDAVQLVTPTSFDQRAGLISFTLKNTGDAEKMRDLTRSFLRQGIHIRVIPRPLCFRASFHLYNSETDVDNLVELLREAT